jgi:hypothetical protein
VCVDDVNLSFGRFRLEEVCSRQYAKNAKDGGWLAYEMLKDSGVIRERGLHQQPSAVAPSSEEDEIRKIAVPMVDGGLRRQRVFGLPIPELSEVEDLKEIRQA